MGGDWLAEGTSYAKALHATATRSVAPCWPGPNRWPPSIQPERPSAHWLAWPSGRTSRSRRTVSSCATLRFSAL